MDSVRSIKICILLNEEKNGILGTTYMNYVTLVL